MKAEFHPNMTHEEYLAYPAISRSMLMTLAKSPRHYWWEYLSGKAEPEDTKPMQIGTALHALVIEPDRFADHIAIVPDDIKRPTKTQINAKNPSEKTVEQIEWWEQFEKRNADKIALRQSEIDEIQLMADAINENEYASKLLSQRGHTEATIIWKDEQTGIKLKWRGDHILSDFTIMHDIKTTANASRRSMQRSIIDYGYDVQVHMGMEAARALGKDPQTFLFTAVEKKPPFCVGLYTADEMVLQSGEKRFRDLLTLLSNCIADNHWPSYTQGYEDAQLPNWHMYEIEGTEEEIEV